MIALDPHSIIALAGLMGLLMALVLFYMRNSYAPTVQGLNEWTGAPLVCFSSTVLFGLRDHLPELWSVWLANMLLYAGCVLYYLGSRRFFGAPINLHVWVIAGGVLALVMLWFTLVQPSYAVRLGCFTLVMAVLFGSHTRLYLHQQRLSFSMRFMLSLLVLQTAMLVVRLGSVLAGDSGTGLNDSSMLQTVYISVYSFTALALTIGAILMATDKVRAEFEHLAAHDSLTGVLNRRAMLDCCAVEFARCGRRQGQMALLMLDVDHFKNLNDTYGHHTGDAVLQSLVRRLQRPLRPGDQLGRYGGEEFVVLLPDTDLIGAATVAERLRVQAASAEEEQAPLPSHTVSIGVATLREAGGTGDSVDAMLRRADAALYRAKAQGRNRVETEA